MFSDLMLTAWESASIVAVVAGVVGFFIVLRGSAFAAHALPNGAFAGAAGASLIGVDAIVGLAVFSILGALTIAGLGRRARHDVATALVIVMMLGLGSLFLSMTTEYAPQIYSLLFGEVLGVSSSELVPIAVIGVVAIGAILLMYRPLMFSSVMPDVAEARGVRSRRMEVAFLLVVALTTTMAVPVVGALLIFSLLISPAAAARSFTEQAVRRHGTLGDHRARHGVVGHRPVVSVQSADRVLRRLHRSGDVCDRPRVRGVAAESSGVASAVRPGASTRRGGLRSAGATATAGPSAPVLSG